MKQRGKKSAGSSLVVPAVSPLVKDERLMPSPLLSDAEQAVWIELVNDQPATAFTATHAPLLEFYCRHVVQGRLLAERILNFDWTEPEGDAGIKQYDKLLTMQERESRAASSLATRLRITRQAIEHPVTAGRAVANKARERKPWETSDDDE